MSEKPRDPKPAADKPEPVAPLPPKIGESKPVNQLTPEEQMALFEKELKETDWGHQPC